MKDFINLIYGIVNDRVENIHTSMACKVEEFHVDDNTVDVSLLYENNLLLVNLPVLYSRKYIESGTGTEEDPYIYAKETQAFEKDDIVLVIFSEKAIDRIITKAVHTPDSVRKFDLSDGMVIGLLYDKED